MDKWTSGEWLAALAIVVSIVAIGTGIWAARKFGTRRGRLLVAHATTRLLTSDSGVSELKVTFRDFDVQDPHLVSIIVKNIGPNDLTKEQFEGGNFRIRLQNSKFYGVVKVASSDDDKPSLVTEGIGAQNMVVEFLPTLLPKGTEWTVDAIVSGPAEPQVLGRLVSTDITEGGTTSQAVLRAMTLPRSFLSIFSAALNAIFRL
ncbi:hypothetical protein [Paenarthrobacter nicotinovorans]|uniref:hypothetical protein n=1 Tax=Paenarthrobacter nicotinovorans TaxID=29320 RepID=UPI000479D562|nr:hypothetical protein [Paenarthrobacter nicotinovorans]